MIVHVWHHMGDVDPASELHRRLMVARESREMEYRAHDGVWHAPALRFTRDSRDVGDDQPVPYVRDMIDQGLKETKRLEDIVFLTNADIGFVPGITERLLAAIRWGRATEGVHMRRRELARVDRPPTLDEVMKGDEYVGLDGCAFTVRWWMKREAIFPDMILGRYGWDSAMRNLIRRSRGPELKNVLWHETHQGPWNATPETIEKNPANAHNRKLLHEWIAKYGGNAEDHLFTQKQLGYK